MISRFYTTAFTTKRMVWVGNASTLTALGSFSGHIQQLSADESEQFHEAYGLAHSVWCAAGTDVQIGDVLTIAAGNFTGTYNVKSVMKNSAVGDNQHYELVVVKNL